MDLRRAIATLAAASIAAAGIALAASLSFGGGSVGMAWESVPRCTTAGLGVIQNVSGTTVISVTVSSLPVACGGATLQVTVNNQLTSSSGSATVPGAGGSLTVALALAVAITAVDQIDLVITGP